MNVVPEGMPRPIQQPLSSEREPIAIIGIGCRYPGDANGPEAFWELVRDGVDAITEIPPDRWSRQAFYDEDPSAAGKLYSQWGGFIDGIDQFDASFFGVGRNEAARMDPQQRILLEVAWEALEDGGVPVERVAGTKTGVFIGVARNDYGEIQLSATEREELNAFTTLGLASCMLANRLSYFFDLKGPSFPIDTACSSSLVAVSLACQSIWQGESVMALAGGVNVILKPEVAIGMSRAFLLAADGRCKSFDAEADGYTRCEGAGVVLLKPLAQAQADGDSIYAVIRGCAINYDGHGDEITVPNGVAQQEAMLTACRQAGIAPEQIQYIEAQGTGSLIGDAIEANALGELIGMNRPADALSAYIPTYIGSVKSNIGHAEAAAGVSGLIKATLALEHKQIPPNLHFQTPNPKIPLDALDLQVPQKLEAWPAPTEGKMRYASVNAFGIGGTNAHVVLSEAPLQPHFDVTDRASGASGDEPVVDEPVASEIETTHDVDSITEPYLFPLSARSPKALSALAERMRNFLLQAGSELSLANICYSASVHRTHHEHRLAFLVTSKDELSTQLSAFLENSDEVEDQILEGPEQSKEALDASLVLLQKRFLAGETVGFGACYHDECVFVRLPTYPWQHKRYWHESDASLADRMGLSDGQYDEAVTPTADIQNHQHVVHYNAAAADSAPTNSAPTNSAPTNSAPTNSAPTDSTPTDSTPTDSSPALLAVQGSSLLTQIAQSHEPRTELSAHISRLVALALDREPADIAPQQGFFEMGFSSLQAIDLLNRLNQSLGITLHSTATFKYPTIEALVDYLLTDSLGNGILEPDGREPTNRAQHRHLPRREDLAKDQDRPSSDDGAEPIAIVGLGCRFPGANTPAEFWELLANGQDAVDEVPIERWPIDAYYDPDPDNPGKTYTRSGGFLEQISRFDPQFFGISPREAEEMDPHQWLLLEVCWEALEHAGIAPDQLRNHLAGVFIGMCADDHLQASGTLATTDIGPYSVLGNARSVAAGRIAYILGAQGPAIQLDTACSSSLVALHYACQSLRLGESDLALAGGVNLMLSPRNMIALCQMKALSPDGRCKTFDAAADGYGRGEGCGMVVLKRLADAKRDGNPILALVRGSAINHDGPSSGLTVPNEQAQERLLRQALRVADVAPQQVSYIETHGTGTPLGDPIEVNAIGSVFGHQRTTPLTLGAVKSNIGHLEAAAGIASVIKVVLAMQHEQIPPQLHVQTPNPYIPWETLPIRIPEHPFSWNGEERLAGCSAFGFSGTNAHILLEATSTSAMPTEPSERSTERPRHLLALSAKNPAALQQLAEAYADALETQPIESGTSLPDVAFTANSGRTHFRRRLALTAKSASEAAEALRTYAAGQATPNIITGEIRPGQRPKLAFLFTGQGSQTAGMGRQLYETQPTFRQLLEQCDEILQPLLGESILPIMFGAELQSGKVAALQQESAAAEQLGNAKTNANKRAISPHHSAMLSQTAYTQPALFAFEYALAKLWQSWGIEPAVVMGHSVGEYVAACLAGAFTLEEGLQLIAARGRLMQALPQTSLDAPSSGGEMAAIFASESTVAAAMEPYADQVAIAALNGPQNIVISGAGQAVHAIVEKLESQGIDAKLLHVSHAFHSPLLEPMLDEFERLAEQQHIAPLKIPLVSNLTGEVLPTGTLLDAHYWRAHTRETIQFSSGIEKLLRQGYTFFLEIGPRAVLSFLGKQISEDAALEAHWLPSVTSSKDAWPTLLETLSTLYTHGAVVDWAGFEEGYSRKHVVLPTYPFQRTFQRTSQNGLGWSTETIKHMNGHTDMQATNSTNEVPLRYPQLEAELQKIVGETLKLDPTAIEVDLPLIELGADSLTLVNAVRTIESSFGIKISVRQFFEELPTVTDLATYLEQQLPAGWGEAEQRNDEAVNGAGLSSLGTNAGGTNGVAIHETGANSTGANRIATNGTGTNSTQTNSGGTNGSFHPSNGSAVVPNVTQPTAVHPVASQPAAAQAAMPGQHSMTPPSMALPPSDAGERERIINGQLQMLGQLMTQQLNLLQGTASVPQAFVPNVPLPENQPAGNGASETSAGTVASESALPMSEPSPGPKQNPAVPTKPRAQQPQTVGPWRPTQTQKSLLSPRQQAHLDALIARYNERTHTSKELTQQHREVLADSRVSVGFRSSIKEMIYPIMGERAQGAHFWDVDGHHYIDMTMGFGTLLFGHTPPFLQEALLAQHQLGVEIGPQLKITGEVAQLVTELTGMERVTFCNSGTEAMMAAIRLARAATGRTKIVHFGGAYHGHSDMTLGMATDGNDDPRAITFFPGISENILADAMVLEYGNMDSLEIIRAHAHELAAVLVEPIQSRRPELQPVEFVQALRQLTEETDIVLIFDEMVTGFRIHPGGAQAWFGVQADLAAYGKIAGGGMPIGIVAGKASIMNYIDGGVWRYGDDSYPSKETIFFGGTFCKHPLAMATAKAALTHIKSIGLEAYEQLNQRTANFADTLNDYFKAEEVPISIVYWGSLFLFRFKSNLDVFFFHLLEKGIFMWEWRNCFLSMAHTDEDIAYFIQAVKETVEELRSGDFLAPAPTGSKASGGGSAMHRNLSTATASATTASVTSPKLHAALYENRSLDSDYGHVENSGAHHNRTINLTDAAAFNPPSKRQATLPSSEQNDPVGKMHFSFYYFGLYDARYAPGKYDLLIAGTRFADANGFRAVWVPERHFHEFGGFSPNPSVLCAALSRESTNIQLRAGSVVLPIHHPVRVVEEWAVVDNLSNGRVGLAMASGWHPNDFIFAPENFGQHRDLTFDTIETVRKLWRGEAETFTNGAGNETPIHVYPLPVQKELPLYLTIVNNPDTYVKAGELGVGILTNLMGQSLEELTQNIERYRTARAAMGHDPDTGEVAVLMHTFVSDDLAHARTVARQPLCDYFRSTIGLFKSMAENMGLQNNFDELSKEQQDEFLNLVYEHYVEERALIGTPESCAEIVEKLQKMGVTEIACFVDSGIEDATVEAHFPQMNALRKLCQARLSQARSEQTDADSPQATPPQPSPNWGGSRDRVDEMSVPSPNWGRLGGGETAPATSAQQQLWLMAQLGEMESLAYNEFVTVTLRGTIHLPSLQQALYQVVARHDALRTTFSDDGMKQIIHPPSPVALPIVDYTELATAERNESIGQWLRTEGGRTFDLQQGPLFTASLLKLDAGEHLLALKAHHTVFDGWSFSVLLYELITFYNGAYGGVVANLPSSMSFQEFAQVQLTHRDSVAMRLHADYWHEQFTTSPPPLDLPTDRPRSAQPTYTATRQSLILGEELVTQLKKVARSHRSTLFMTLFAAYTTLLHRLANQDDLVVGTPVSGRFDSASEGMIGYGTHLLPIRTAIDSSATFAQHLAATRKLILDGFEHEAYPFAWLLERLQEESQTERAPLIRTTFNMDQRLDLSSWHGLEVDVTWQPRQAAPFEVTFNAIEIDGTLQLDCDYNTDLFDEVTIDRWLSHFQTLMESIVADATQTLSALPLLTMSEHQKLLSLWDAPPHETGQKLETRCLHQWFEMQAEQTPDAVALTFKAQTLTYLELNQQANQVAHYLQSLGIGHESIVGLCLERSTEMLVALLGILKAGGAYLPLDPTYPQERLAFMVEDAQPVAIVTRSDFIADIPLSDTQVVCLERDAPSIAKLPTENPSSEVTADQLAYIIYTSGSTGRPKGALIHHRNVTRLFSSTEAWYHFGQQDVWTLFHSISFDFSVWEVWGALLYGGRLVIVPHAVSRSPEEFYGLLVREQVTVLNQTPSAFRQLIGIDQQKTDDPLLKERLELRYVIFGGEALEIQSLRPWFDKYGDQTPRLVNMYGITETTVHVTYRPLSAADLASTASVIGQPIPDLQLYLLDQAQQPVPIGVAGELYVGGAGVGQGYLNRPELTAERYLENPFGQNQLYRTGDMARYRLRADGTWEIEYLGRADNQVKIRGFRIELGEIEAVLNQNAAVQESVVLVEGRADEKRLVAYLVANVPDEADSFTLQPCDPATLRDYLKQKVPSYMVPATFVSVDSIPLTANGKVDRNALTKLGQTESQVSISIAPPKTDTESTLIDIWSDVLGQQSNGAPIKSQIGIHNDFFDLGGQSLLVARVVGRINAEFGIELPMRTLFELSTVALLAERVDLLKTAQRLQTVPDATTAQEAERAEPREEILL
ncbi:MAG: MupA/Atu3671 family FMN-dependent luciferase-like monooxygenase [Chloroflexota bacterium]